MSLRVPQHSSPQHRKPSGRSAAPDTADFLRLHNESTERLRDTWKAIIDKYSAFDLEEDQGDVIDLRSGELIVDTGHLQSLDDAKTDRSSDFWSSDYFQSETRPAPSVTRSVLAHVASPVRSRIRAASRSVSEIRRTSESHSKRSVSRSFSSVQLAEDSFETILCSPKPGATPKSAIRTSASFFRSLSHISARSDSSQPGTPTKSIFETRKSFSATRSSLYTMQTPRLPHDGGLLDLLDPPARKRVKTARTPEKITPLHVSTPKSVREKLLQLQRNNRDDLIPSSPLRPLSEALGRSGRPDMGLLDELESESDTERSKGGLNVADAKLTLPNSATKPQNTPRRLKSTPQKPPNSSKVQKITPHKLQTRPQPQPHSTRVKSRLSRSSGANKSPSRSDRSQNHNHSSSILDALLAEPEPNLQPNLKPKSKPKPTQAQKRKTTKASRAPRPAPSSTKPSSASHGTRRTPRRSVPIRSGAQSSELPSDLESDPETELLAEQPVFRVLEESEESDNSEYSGPESGNASSRATNVRRTHSGHKSEPPDVSDSSDTSENSDFSERSSGKAEDGRNVSQPHTGSPAVFPGSTDQSLLSNMLAVPVAGGGVSTFGAAPQFPMTFQLVPVAMGSPFMASGAVAANSAAMPTAMPTNMQVAQPSSGFQSFQQVVQQTHNVYTMMNGAGMSFATQQQQQQQQHIESSTVSGVPLEQSGEKSRRRKRRG